MEESCSHLRRNPWYYPLFTYFFPFTNLFTLIAVRNHWRIRGAPLARPPNRINFFRFHIHFCPKVYTSEVGDPPTGRRPPQREILDPPLVTFIYSKYFRQTTKLLLCDKIITAKPFTCLLDWHLTSSLSDHTGIEFKFWKVKVSDRMDQLRLSLLEMRELEISEFLLLASVAKTRLVLTVARRLGIVAVPFAWLILHLVWYFVDRG